jgi:hypothetical protein
VIASVASISRFKGPWLRSTLLGVVFGTGVEAIRGGVKGGAVAAIVGTSVGPVPGAQVGAIVGSSRVGVGVGSPAISIKFGANRVAANKPQAKTPDTMAMDIRIIDERGN